MNEMFYSRRMFLKHGAQLLSAAGTLPLFLDRSARAMAAEVAKNPQGAGRPDRILVIVQLAGGNDGLNTVVPITNDDYYRARPKLAVPKQKAIRITDDFGLHPSASGLGRLYDKGYLGIVQAVGYPNPNRSHFRSTDIWATAEAERVGQSGWLGRYFDACCSGQDPGEQKLDASAAIALLNEPPGALVGEKYLPMAFRSPDNLSYKEGRQNPRLKDAFEKLNDLDPEEMMMEQEDEEHLPMRKPGRRLAVPLGTHGSLNARADETEDFLQRTALNARVYAEQIKASAARVQNQVRYPATNRLALDLKLVAQMIGAEMPTRVYYVGMGGFDTHSQQDNRHPILLDRLSSALEPFVMDLKAMGHLDRVTIMTFSEFGRRVAENGSSGTDHGAAAPLFMIGSSVKPGIHGHLPSLAPANLNRGDVPFRTDFRSVYATVLKQWLKADDAKALGKRFEPVPILRTASA